MFPRVWLCLGVRCAVSVCGWRYLCARSRDRKMSKITKFVDEIADDPKKGIIWAILIVLFVIILFYAWNKISKLISGISSDISKNRDNPVTSANLTHNGAWYKNAADTLFNAMDGMGTDEDTIYGVFYEIDNQDDWNELVRKYDTRKLSNGPLMGSITGTLQVHLKSELTQSEITKCKNILAGINTGL